MSSGSGGDAGGESAVDAATRLAAKYAPGAAGSKTLREAHLEKEAQNNRSKAERDRLRDIELKKAAEQAHRYANQANDYFRKMSEEDLLKGPKEPKEVRQLREQQERAERKRQDQSAWDPRMAQDVEIPVDTKKSLKALRAAMDGE